MSYIVKIHTANLYGKNYMFVEVDDPRPGELIFHGQFKPPRMGYGVYGQKVPNETTRLEPVGPITWAFNQSATCVVREGEKFIQVPEIFLTPGVPIYDGDFEPSDEDNLIIEHKFYPVVVPKGEVIERAYKGDARTF